MQEWHGVRDTAIKDRRSNRDDGKSGPGTMLQGEPRKDGRSGRDVGRNRNATTALGTETERVITSGKQENTQQDLQADRRAGDREANGQVFCQDSKNEYQNIVEEPATPKRKKRLHTA
jgi:hypothetical protein